MKEISQKEIEAVKEYYNSVIDSGKKFICSLDQEERDLNSVLDYFIVGYEDYEGPELTEEVIDKELKDPDCTLLIVDQEPKMGWKIYDDLGVKIFKGEEEE